MVWRGAAVASRETPAPSGVVATYDSASVAEARAVLAHGIERRVSLLTLTGKRGAGTSATLRSLVERLHEQFLLVMPPAPVHGLADVAVPLLRALGRPYVDAPADELLRAVTEALGVRTRPERPVALLLDDAEAVPESVLAALDAFGPRFDDEQALMPVVLAGRPALLATLARMRFSPLRRGLTIDVRLHTPVPLRAQAAGEEGAAPPRLRLQRARPPRRELVLAVLCACLGASAALLFEQQRASARLPLEVVAHARPRPVSLGAVVAPAAAVAAPGPDELVGPVLPDPAAALRAEARDLAVAFETAYARGDSAGVRRLLAPDVAYNGVKGADDAMPEPPRGIERPSFLPPTHVETGDDGVVVVRAPVSVPYRDAAGARGDVRGRASWRMARRDGRLQIVAVDYDLTADEVPGGGDG